MKRSLHGWRHLGEHAADSDRAERPAKSPGEKAQRHETACTHISFTLALALTALFALTACGTEKARPSQPKQSWTTAPTRSASQNLATSTADKSLLITYYYDDPCAACKTGDSFAKKFREEMGPLLGDRPYQLNTVNLFKDDSPYNKILASLGLKRQDNPLPALLIGRRLINGDAGIKADMKRALCEALKLPYRAVLYYYRPDCPDCQRIKPMLETFWRAHPNVEVQEIDVTPVAEKQKFKNWLREQKVPEDQWQIPFLRQGERWLSGDKAIEKDLKAFLKLN